LMKRQVLPNPRREDGMGADAATAPAN
jgi:hypothetical protein